MTCGDATLLLTEIGCDGCGGFLPIVGTVDIVFAVHRRLTLTDFLHTQCGQLLKYVVQTPGGPLRSGVGEKSIRDGLDGAENVSQRQDVWLAEDRVQESQTADEARMYEDMRAWLASVMDLFPADSAN